MCRKSDASFLFRGPACWLSCRKDVAGDVYTTSIIRGDCRRFTLSENLFSFLVKNDIVTDTVR